MIFDEDGLHDDPLYLECAIFATLTLIRPHECRTKYAAHVDRLAFEPAARARLLAMIGLGDAWAGNLVRGQAEMLEARDLAARAGRLDVQAEVTAWLIKCEALRGDLESSAEHLAEARMLAARNGSGSRRPPNSGTGRIDSFPSPSSSIARHTQLCASLGT